MLKCHLLVKRKEDSLKNLKEAMELYMEDTSIDGMNKMEDPEIIYSQIEPA